MELIVERCAGIDVHQAQLTVCVRVPGEAGKRVEELASFGTTTPDLLALADWLSGHGVTQVAMEGRASTGNPATGCSSSRSSCGSDTRDSQGCGRDG